MTTNIRYWPGGFIPAAPAQNKAEQWDTSAGYTAWDAQGSVTTQRSLTAAEAAALATQDADLAASSNHATIQQQAQTALVGNRTYLAIGTPTNAQVAAQVAALTRQVQALIRLALNQFDATN